MLGTTITDLDWLLALPVLTRRRWQDLGDAMLSRTIPSSHGPSKELRTSGSTGEPVRVWRTGLNGSIWAAHTMLDHEWHNRDFRGRLLAVRGDIHERVSSDGWGFPVAMMERSGPGLGLPITTDIGRLVEEIDGFNPNVLLTYPSMLAACLDAWRGRGGFPRGIRHIKTIGETVGDRLRTMAADTTGLDVEDCYSSNELGTIAITCDLGSYHVMVDSMILEVLDGNGDPCADGDVGRVVLTDLSNFATPIVRYDIGDWAMAGGECACGRTGPTLRRVMGRTRNLVVKPDGTRHWPLTGFAGFEDIALIRQYQLIQHAIGDIELRIVCATDIPADAQARLVDLVRRFLGHDFPIRISRQCDPFDLAPNGKHEEFICKVV